MCELLMEALNVETANTVLRTGCSSVGVWLYGQINTHTHLRAHTNTHRYRQREIHGNAYNHNRMK